MRWNGEKNEIADTEIVVIKRLGYLLIINWSILFFSQTRPRPLRLPLIKMRLLNACILVPFINKWNPWFVCFHSLDWLCQDRWCQRFIQAETRISQVQSQCYNLHLKILIIMHHMSPWTVWRVVTRVIMLRPFVFLYHFNFFI